MAKQKSKKSSNGEILIRIKPSKTVDKDYFEFLQSEITVEQDDHFYKWIDHYLSKVYDKKPEKFFEDLLNKGIGEVISTIHFEKDIAPKEPQPDQKETSKKKEKQTNDSL